MPETENSIISELLDDVSFKENICAHFTNPVQPAEYSTLPDTLDDRLASILKQSGIDHLYNHQRFAWDAIQQKQHTVISTGVASGKSLCYQLPLLQSYLEDSESRAILLFPTKALAQDQRSGLEKFNQNLSTEFNLRPPGIGVYDGDLPSGQRDAVRKTASFIFTNPDMLHFGILPHHTQWAQFLRNLKYIIIDEVHVYRGIFGSHFTNVIRRLKRIASFYGAIPQFIITSATLANSHTYINALIEEEAVLISSDTAPHGESHFLIYNPPLLNEELGIRKPAMEETVSIARQLLRQDLQTLVFAQTRKAVELILSSLHLHTADKSAIVGYRSGYLPQERRQIEEGLRNGKIRMVVATNALELGIDIGGIDVVLLNGYPGSITSTRQQAGRAGRKGLPSAAILVASAGLLDQYLARNPDYLIHGNIEAALINPDNPYILFHHLQCALFEKTFQKNESFGKLSPEKVREFFQLLEKVGKLHHSQDEYFWSSTSYPANDISLRTAGADNYILQTEDEVIGIVDQESAFWMAHPGAVYIHNGSPYLVDDLDIEHHKALLKST
ncbi:MAG: DEAD/DEAH box helicase, partial [FCB group bacterium]|nr:DEAD/DEAH box helicase [FCB group bacterium]